MWDILEGQIPGKPPCLGLSKGCAGAHYKHKSSTLIPQDGRTNLIKPTVALLLFRGKARAGMQFLHTTEKGGFILPDPGISCPGDLLSAPDALGGWMTLPT